LEAKTHRKLAEVARALNESHPARGQLPALFFLTDEIRIPDPLPAIEALPEGCGVVFRHYDAESRAALAAKVLAGCRAQGRLCLIGADAALAQDLGADGVHLPEHMVRTLTDRPKGKLVTAAAHDEAALRAAADLGADAAFVSPVFATESHPGAASLGVERFAALAASTSLPVYALGGITDENAERLAESGAAGLAAIGGLL
jgi:thiamine-phosphate pyrophosphorylase